MARNNNRRPTETPPEIDYQELFNDALTGEARMSDIYSQGYEYSLLNQQYLYSQGAREPVASYKGWQELGCQVLKGSRGFYIIRPITIKSKDELDEHGQPRQYLKFKPVRGAFGYSQTDRAESLPEPVEREWTRERMLGALGHNLVAYNDISLNMQGYSYDRNVAINPMAPYPDKTAAHEAAHIESGHTGDEFDYDQHRGLAEVEAESAAFITAHEVGLPMDVQGSRHYIQSYRDVEMQRTMSIDSRDAIPEASIRRIFRVANAIIRAGYESQEQALGETA